MSTYALYAARKIYDLLTEGQDDIEPSPLDKECTMCFGDIDIKSPEMQQILKHKYTDAEKEWQLPEPYPTDIRRFLNGPRLAKESQPEKSVSLSAPVRPKVDKTGLINIQQVCEEMKINPRDARAMLRKAKVEKPAGGWNFKPDQVEEIKKLINKGLKK